MTPPSPSTASSPPRTSGESRRLRSPLSGTRASAASAPRISGTLATNSHRHDAWSTSQPPTNGPNVVPSVARPAQTPMPRARSDTRSVPFRSARLDGTTMAAPIPCATRAPIRNPDDGASAHGSDATSITVSPTARIRRRPNRSENAPATSSRPATASRYPVRIHCTDATLACRSRLIAGTATVTTLASKNPTVDASVVATMSAVPAGLRTAISPAPAPPADGAATTS